MSVRFVDEFKASLGKDLVADGTSELKTNVVDGSGFDSTIYVVMLGDVDAAAVMTFTPKENTANSTTSPTPTAVTLDRISSSAGVITNGAVVLTESSGNLDDKIIIIEVQHSAASKQYQFLSITVADESFEADKILTLQGRPRTVPVTQSSDVVAVASAAK